MGKTTINKHKLIDLWRKTYKLKGLWYIIMIIRECDHCIKAVQQYSRNKSTVLQSKLLKELFLATWKILFNWICLQEPERRQMTLVPIRNAHQHNSKKKKRKTVEQISVFSLCRVNDLPTDNFARFEGGGDNSQTKYLLKSLTSGSQLEMDSLLCPDSWRDELFMCL